MIWSTQLRYGIGALLVCSQAAAQAPDTASISGHLLSEDGRTLRASVTLSFAKPRGFPSPPRRTFTGTDGAFTFPRLPAGSYTLCVQVSPSEPAPANSPFVDTCVWPSPQTPIALSAGQQLAGIVFTAPKGAWLQIHVADPDHVLPQAVPAKGPPLLEPKLQLILKGPDGLYRHARLTSIDSTGRNYQAAIPLKTVLALKITSSVANPFDQGGNQLSTNDTVAFQPSTPANLNPVTFTIHRKAP